MKWFTAIALLGALCACQQPEKDPGPSRYTYSIDYPATPTELALIQAAYLSWAQALGISLGQVDHDGLVSLIAAEPPPDSDTYAMTTTHAKFGRLTSAQILLSPSSLLAYFDQLPSYAPERFRSVLLHEIGHTLSLGHTPQCFTTMYPATIFQCQPQTISTDAIVAAKAAVSAGWIAR